MQLHLTYLFRMHIDPIIIIMVTSSKCNQSIAHLQFSNRYCTCIQFVRCRFLSTKIQSVIQYWIYFQSFCIFNLKPKFSFKMQLRAILIVLVNKKFEKLILIKIFRLKSFDYFIWLWPKIARQKFRIYKSIAWKMCGQNYNLNFLIQVNWNFSYSKWNILIH